MNTSKQIQLVKKILVTRCPRAHIHHTSNQIWPIDRDFLPDTTAHAHQADQVHVGPVEIVQELDQVFCIQPHRSRGIRIIS